MNMTPLEQAVAFLPRDLRLAVLGMGQEPEEIRLRAGRQLSISNADGRELPVPLLGRPVMLTADDLRLTLEIATGASYHSVVEKLCQGFLPLKGGHRLGITGTVDIREGKIHGYRSLSSLCLRVAHPVQGIGKAVADGIFQAPPISTLILSPPGNGKTTLLRELVRLASDRHGLRVGLADERGEVAALWKGVPQFDVGASTDVLDGCPKAEGLQLLLRTMNPQLLAADEITAPEDIAALSMGANCGVPVLATAHGGSIEELNQRPLYRTLLQENLFQQVVLIRRQGSVRTYQLCPIAHD
jgi:stage III sporulation protein AA